ncbi:MAG: hypothetical protein QMD25_00860 [Caldisericia bacterium]|jgi:hypothetical protein|nr:hypothetical protein [Caldisericia bacterium]
MKKLLFILSFLILFSLAFKEINVQSIIDILNIFDEGEKLGLVKINDISFERKENIIRGYLVFSIEKDNIVPFENFLKSKNINFINLKEGENKVYLKENIKNLITNDFKTTFLSTFFEIFSSKFFYFIFLILIIFYLLILPNI